MAASETVAQIETALRASADPERASHDQAYLKSHTPHWGVPVPAARAAIRIAAPSLERTDLLPVVDLLWGRGVHDTRLAAALLLDRDSSLLEPRDLPWLEGMIREAGTWALVDLLVPRPLAAIDEVDPTATTAELDRWCGDEDFWLRRAALLAHLMPFRAGWGDWPRFTRYAERLLDDPQFFVRKAMGWVLREAARSRPSIVAAWLAPRADRISGVALREAVKPLEGEDREALLAVYRSGGGGRRQDAGG